MLFADPIANIKELSLQEGMRIVDIGAGSGFYTLSAAKLVGESGKVYAVDVQKDLLLKLKSEAVNRHLLNVEIIWGNAEEKNGTKLSDRSVDAIIISNVLFQIENKTGLAAEAARILRPRGKVLIIDWMDSFGGVGPHPDHVIRRDKARELFTSGGFSLLREFDAGEHHYGLILERK